MTLPTDSDAYYRYLGDGLYQPTIHVQGAWSDREQHMAPVSGLVVHELERHEPREDLQLAQVSFDILGMIHAEETTIRVRTLRPGRTIELLEATASAGGRDVIRATAWRLSRQDTSAVAVTESEPMPDPETVPVSDHMAASWPGGFISSVEFRHVPGWRPGRAKVWLRTEHPLVEDEESSGLARFVGLVDTANGVAVRARPGEYVFPNTDLTLHFHRTPEGPWVGLDVTVEWGPTGVGANHTTLHDQHGPVGHALQIITLRPPA